MPSPSTRTAVEVADEARSAAPAKVSAAEIVRTTIDRQKPAFAAVLPANVDPDRWARLTLTAIKGAPDLMQAFGTVQGQTSVLLAAMQCATVGLEPNTPTQDAWILPRKNKGVWEGQLQIGYRGLLKLARRSGEIATVYAQVVREGDEFEFGYGIDGPWFTHRPHPEAWPDDEESEAAVTHAYASVAYVNGGRDFEVMTKAQINRRRKSSASAGSSYSPWSQWYAEMARKTVLRALAKRLPLTTEAAQVAATDEAQMSLGDGEVKVDYIDAESDELDPTDEMVAS